MPAEEQGRESRMVGNRTLISQRLAQTGLAAVLMVLMLRRALVFAQSTVLTVLTINDVSEARHRTT
jgi:hypothetical protein